MKQEHNDTLVVIPYDHRRPNAEKWLSEAIESIGNWPWAVADNVQWGPAHGVAMLELDRAAMWGDGFPRYVFNLDADDKISQPDAIAVMRQAMVDTEACCIFARFQAFNEHGIQPYPHQPFPTAEYFKHSFNQRGLRGFDWEKVRSIGGIDTTLKRFEWFDLARRLTHRYGDPAYVDRVLSFYRLHPDQLTEHGAQPPEFQWVLNRPLL